MNVAILYLVLVSCVIAQGFVEQQKISDSSLSNGLIQDSSMNLRSLEKISTLDQVYKNPAVSSNKKANYGNVADILNGQHEFKQQPCDKKGYYDISGIGSLQKIPGKQIYVGRQTQPLVKTEINRIGYVMKTPKINNFQQAHNRENTVPILNIGNSEKIYAFEKSGQIGLGYSKVTKHIDVPVKYEILHTAGQHENVGQLSGPLVDEKFYSIRRVTETSKANNFQIGNMQQFTNSNSRFDYTHLKPLYSHAFTVESNPSAYAMFRLNPPRFNELIRNGYSIVPIIPTGAPMLASFGNQRKTKWHISVISKSPQKFENNVFAEKAFDESEKRIGAGYSKVSMTIGVPPKSFSYTIAPLGWLY